MQQLKHKFQNLLNEPRIEAKSFFYVGFFFFFFCFFFFFFWMQNKNLRNIENKVYHSKTTIMPGKTKTKQKKTKKLNQK